jgi:hypothetical protein
VKLFLKRRAFFLLSDVCGLDLTYRIAKVQVGNIAIFRHGMMFAPRRRANRSKKLSSLA